MSTDDLMEIQQLLGRYAVHMTRGDIDGVLAVFTPDGTYSAFGDTYGLDEFPALVAAAPQGLFLVGTAVVELPADGDQGRDPDGEQDGDRDGVGNTATGTQPLCFIDHATHAMRIGYYNDTYLRTTEGWRLRTRAMTFIRRSGAHDSGRPHAFERPGA